jgi:hypothetical protein
MRPFAVEQKKNVAVHLFRERVRETMRERLCLEWKSVGGFVRKGGVGLFLSAATLLGAGVCVEFFATPSAQAAGEGAGRIDPVALLKGVREAQASIKQTLQGKLRKGSRSISYRMVMEGQKVRFEFPNATPPSPTLVSLQFGEKSSSLEVATSEGVSKKVDFSDEIDGMGVCFEDLALRFLYWGDASLEGEESLMLAKCWKIRVRRPAKVVSPYKEVLVWVSQTDAAFLKSESYGEDGRLLKRLTVRRIQSLDQVTTLKQLRIESPGKDDVPTYLDVDGQTAPRAPK